jgi:chromosome segregation ATPase
MPIETRQAMSKSKQVSSEDSGNTLAEILKELKGFREESSIMAAEVKEIKSAVNDLRASVEYTQAEVDSIKADLCNTKTVLAEVKITNSSLTSDVESLKYKVLALERYSRSYNIRIGGIMEGHGENCMDHVVNILTKLGYSEDFCRIIK